MKKPVITKTGNYLIIILVIDKKVNIKQKSKPIHAKYYKANSVYKYPKEYVDIEINPIK